MEHIHTLYHNDFGIAFHWKQNKEKNIPKIQLVFRETGLFLSKEELFYFKSQIKKTLSHAQKCNNCTEQNNCNRSLLLETPVAQLSFAVNKSDLYLLVDLIEGTLFKLCFNQLLSINHLRAN